MLVVLGFSRLLWLSFFRRQDMRTLFIGLEQAFSFFGGVPRELLFPAPFRPRGHVVMGFDDRGHCPMLVDDRCSIYEHRPRACRTYDCRVFAATGVEVDDPNQRDVGARARRWRFTFASAAEREDFDALRATAARLRAESPELTATAIAVRAVDDR